MKIDRTVAPAIKEAIHFDFHLPECNKEILSNNIPLYWYAGGSQEVVQIEWVFEAGIWHEEKTGIAQTVASLLKNGTSTKTAYQINEAIETYGASLRIQANNDFSTITLQMLTKHLDKVLPYVLEILTDAQFPEEELQVFKQNALQRLAVNLQRADFVANRNIDALLFGSTHPYGKYTEVQDLEAILLSDLRDFYKKYYQPHRCKMFMSGSFDISAIQKIQHLFGASNWTDDLHVYSSTQYNIQIANQLHHRIINNKNSVQGAVRIAKHFPQRTHPDFPALIVLNTLFGGYFGSRLMSNIREEKGYTYGIYAQLFSYQNAGVLLVATEAGIDVCEATTQEAFNEMAILQNEIIDEQELLLVKNYILGNLLGDLDGPFSIMLRWKTLILNNLDLQHFYKTIDIYKKVDATTLQNLAQQYYTPSTFFDLIVQ